MTASPNQSQGNKVEHWLLKVRTNLDDLSQSVKNATGTDARNTMQRAIEEKDWEFIHDVLQFAWNSAPDKPEIHTWPKWDVLCDLLSDRPDDPG